MNTLNRALAKAIELGILRRLARRELATTVSLYADDEVIFCHPDETELRAIRGILELFGHSTGLHTNFAKCSVSAIACTEEVADAAAVVMECQLAPFPVKYLGIPLSVGRLPGEAFQPVVDRLADKLPTWKASMMPQAGRLALVRSVLAAIPLHQLMVLSFCKKARAEAGQQDSAELPLGWEGGGQRWSLPCQLVEGVPPAAVWGLGDSRPRTHGH
jgi:hypothetical protein